jgi:hypothetical protein
MTRAHACQASPIKPADGADLPSMEGKSNAPHSATAPLPRQAFGGLDEYDKTAWVEILLCGSNDSPFPTWLMYVRVEDRHNFRMSAAELLAYTAGSA